MGQILHGSATTTEAVRRAIQHSEESLRALAKRYGINQKTVAKWKGRTSVADRPTGPKAPKSTVLSLEDEAIVVAFRRHTLLPLDDCLYSLQATIPHLTRSSLHRCLQRHGISRLPEVAGDEPPKKKFKSYPIGFFHIDIAEVQTAEGKLYLFVAIDRTSKFAFVQLVESANRVMAFAFLIALIAAVPYKIHTILTDNGIQFRFAPRYANGPTARYMTHMFEMRCHENGIEHRFTKINHPWTNGQVERMNRTIKDATVKRYHYDSHDQLRRHLADFIDAYNFGRRLKTLKGLTPYEFICKCWTSEPKRFKFNPLQKMPGLNTAANDTLNGTSFADNIYGLGGIDTINSGAGNDLIDGGLGSDTLTGGAGLDTFVFGSTLGATNVDKITDFSVSADNILLAQSVFTAIGAVGSLSSDAFRIGSAAASATDRIIYNTATGALFYDADGNGSGAQVQFATLATNLSLTAASFRIG